MPTRYKETDQEVRQQCTPVSLHISEPVPEVLIRWGRSLRNINLALYSSNVVDLLVKVYLLVLSIG